jgi:hypothetical protein
VGNRLIMLAFLDWLALFVFLEAFLWLPNRLLGDGLDARQG